METTVKKSSQAAAIEETQSKLEQEDAKSDHVLQQLATGERALLQHWLIRNQP